MAFPAMMINASDGIAAASVVTPGAGADNSGLFQMLLAGATGESAAAIPIATTQAAPVATTQTAPVSPTLNVALLLQSADTPPAEGLTPPPETNPQVQLTPSLFTAPPVAEGVVATPQVQKPAVSALATAHAPATQQAPAKNVAAEAPQAATPTQAAPQGAETPVAASGDVPAETANPTAPALQQVIAAAPDAVQAILFAPLLAQATPTSAAPTKSAPIEAAAADTEAPQASPQATFKKIVFTAQGKPTAPNADSAATAKTIGADTLAAPQGQPRTDANQPGAASPLTGFDAPRPAGESLAAPVARAPNGAAAMQIAQHIGKNFNGQSTSFEVRLDPAELGRVDVKISVDHEKRVTAAVSADNPQTLTDLRGAARDIERALNEAGLDLTQGGLSFDLNQRHASDDEFDAAPYGALKNESGAEETISIAARPFGMERWSNSGVDVWA